MYQSLYRPLIQLDRKLFLIINQFHHPWADQVIYWITHEAFWIPLYALLLYLIITSLRSNLWIALVAIAILIVICEQFASGLVKPLIQRLRPCFNPELQSIVHVVGKYHGIYGFISSHATNTFGLATFICLLLQKKYSSIRLLFIWALVVSYGRIYGGVHYPTDILVGALSGVEWAYIMFRLYVHTTRLTNKSGES